MKRTFTIYNDPGHAWARVDFATLSAIGMHAGKFSRCSYVSDKAIFLEEDCDLPLFIKAYTAWTGRAPRFIERYCEGASRIRSYESNIPTDKSALLAYAIASGRLSIIPG